MKSLGLPLLIGFGFVLGIMLFVWPTQWRYFTWKSGTTEIPIRSHRVTDHTQRLTLNGWVAQVEASPMSEPERDALDTPLPKKEVLTTTPSQASGDTQAGIEVRKDFVYSGALRVDIYNGSSEEIAGVHLEVSRTDGGASRQFEVDQDVRPQESKSVNFATGLDDEQVGDVRLLAVKKT